MKWFILNEEELKYQFMFTSNTLIWSWIGTGLLAFFIGYFIGISR